MKRVRRHGGIEDLLGVYLEINYDVQTPYPAFYQ